MHMKVSEFNGLTCDTVTAKQIAAEFIVEAKQRGVTIRMIRFVIELIGKDETAGLKLLTDTVSAFGVGSEDTIPELAHRSFKAAYIRECQKQGMKECYRWKRSSDAVVTDVELVKFKVKPEAVKTGDTGDTGDTGQPVTVADTGQPDPVPVKCKSVADVVKLVLDKKPGRTKISTICIALLDTVGIDAVTEVMAALQKRIAAEQAEQAEQAETVAA